jgi:hypothetical protein
MTDRVPEIYTELRVAARKTQPANPYSRVLLFTWVIAGVIAPVFLWNGIDSKPGLGYDPEYVVFNGVGYVFAGIAAVAALIHLAVKAILWTPPQSPT